MSEALKILNNIRTLRAVQENALWKRWKKCSRNWKLL